MATWDQINQAAMHEGIPPKNIAALLKNLPRNKGDYTKQEISDAHLAVFGNPARAMKFLSNFSNSTSFSNGQNRAKQEIANKCAAAGLKVENSTKTRYSDIAKWELDAKKRGASVRHDTKTGSYHAVDGSGIIGMFITHPSAGKVGGWLESQA